MVSFIIISPRSRIGCVEYALRTAIASTAPRFADKGNTYTEVCYDMVRIAIWIDISYILITGDISIFGVPIISIDL